MSLLLVPLASHSRILSNGMLDVIFPKEYFLVSIFGNQFIYLQSPPQITFSSILSEIPVI